MRLILFLFLVFLFINILAQDISGDWQGIAWQPNSYDTFSYQLHLSQNGHAVFGQAVSRSANGLNEAVFQLSGQIEKGVLTFQEIKQLRPSSPQWCLKFVKGKLLPSGEIDAEWSATGCKDGKMLLRPKGTKQQEYPLSYAGRWTGHLSQSDRAYGFYFEMNLNDDGTGTSHIVSEGAGGEAVHQLRWAQKENGIHFIEPMVKSRTQPDWKWCLKSAQLLLNKHHANYELKGQWDGFIEDKTPSTGACASGTLFLSKAITLRAVSENTATESEKYSQQNERSVRVDRVIQVQSNHIRIKVWDNGVVDGDVLTLFLNGRRLLKEYRVNKRKWSIPVDIQEGENLLILHAEDLGDIPPNTVAVSIDDGVEEQIIVISSNLKESGAILIQPFEF